MTLAEWRPSPLLIQKLPLLWSKPSTQVRSPAQYRLTGRGLQPNEAAVGVDGNSYLGMFSPLLPQRLSQGMPSLSRSSLVLPAFIEATACRQRLRTTRAQQRQQRRLEALAWAVGGCFGPGPVEAALHLLSSPLEQRIAAFTLLRSVSSGACHCSSKNGLGTNPQALANMTY